MHRFISTQLSQHDELKVRRSTNQGLGWRGEGGVMQPPQVAEQNGWRNKYLNEENLFSAGNKFYITEVHISKINTYL